eukprot:3681331-Heterocapsa_arctica.AAC.1
MAVILSGLSCQLNSCTILGAPTKYLANRITFCQSHRLGVAILRHTSSAANWRSARSIAR